MYLANFLHRNIGAAAVLLLSAAFLGAGASQAASGISAGTIEINTIPGTITLGDLSQSLAPQGNNSNRCQLAPSTGDNLLQFSSNVGNPSISLQRNSMGINTTRGQGCGFAVENEVLTIDLGSDVPALANVVDFDITFIVTGDAVFELRVFDADGALLDGGDGYSYRVYTGKSACDPFGTSGSPLVTGPYETTEFACTAQSNPNSNFAFSLDEGRFTDRGDWRRIEIVVLTGEVGITALSFELGLTPTGTLTCEDDPAPGGATTTTVSEIFDVGGGVQCRRLPNRDGTQCVAVPYLIDSECTGGDCTVDFLHGDQAGVAREDFAFVCEVWWPERPGNFSAGQPLLNRTEISWGGIDTPLTLGDGPVDYCPGITPVFSAVPEPNPGTDCGSALSYLLSQPADTGLMTPPVDGGTVTSNVSPAECSLLEAYDDVLVPASFPDQCTSSGCPTGRQIACLVDSRTSQVEDTSAACDGGGAGSCPGVNPGDVDSATSLFRNYELIYIQGDLRMRRF